MATLRPFRTASIALAAFAAGCSLVNALDDVTAPRETGYSTTPKVDAPLVDGAADGGDALAPGDHAVLVVGGTASDREAGEDIGDAVLAVLDTATGRDIGAREKMHVAGLVHDAPRDLWYIFEAPSNFIAAPSDVVKLHIRKLDTRTGAWTELSSTVVPSLVYYDAIAPTNARLSFMAHPAEAGGSFRMVTLDTSNPAAPHVLADQDVPLLPMGMIATRSSTGPGGQVTLVNVGTAADCAAAGFDAGAPGLCGAKLHRFLIPNGGAPVDLNPPVGFLYGAMATNGQIAYGSVVCGGGPDELLVMTKPLAGPHDVHLVGYQSATGNVAVSYAMNLGATRVKRAAVDQVRRVVFVVETNTDTNLYAIPLAPLADGGANSVKSALRHSGQSVFYDQASQTVFSPFSQGAGFTFSAFRVSGTTAAVQLRERTASSTGGDWDPPADLRPVLLGIRNPATFACP